MRFLSCLLLVLSGSPYSLAYNMQAPILPDPIRSPGDVLTSDPTVICVPGYTKTVRNVPQALKEQVYRSYGITSRRSGEYEIDHIISLELGGSNSIRNLYPESYKTQPLNAHVKDTLENKLHALACSGALSFPEAQHAIASNWTTAYVKYVGPLPGGAQPVVPSRVPSQALSKALPVPALPPSRSPAHNTTRVVITNSEAGPNSDGSCPASAPIKGSTSHIYHLPVGDSNYSRTHAQHCFATPQDAQAAGYRSVK